MGLMRETFRKQSKWLIKLKGHGRGRGPTALAGEGTVEVMLIGRRGRFGKYARASVRLHGCKSF